MSSIPNFLVLSSTTYPTNSGAGRNAFRIALEITMSNSKYSGILLAPSYSLKTTICKYENLNVIGFPSTSWGGIGKIINEISVLPFIFYYSLKCKQSLIYSTASGHKALIVLNWLQGKKTIFRSSSLDQDDIVTLVSKRGSFLKKFNEYIYSRITVYWAISTEFEKRFLAVFKQKKTSVLRCFQGVNTNLFAPVTLQERIEIRESLTIKPNDFVILSVGYVLKRKGILDNIYALQQLKLKFDFKYIVVGDYKPNSSDPYHKKWNASRISEMDEIFQIGRKTLGDSIMFIGRTDNPSNYMKVADVFLHSSYAEGMPNSVIEAMACGLPIIMRNLPGVSADLITNEHNGYLIKDINEIKICTKKLYYDKAKREKMGNNALQYIKKIADIKEIAQQILSKWEE